MTASFLFFCGKYRGAVVPEPCPYLSTPLHTPIEKELELELKLKFKSQDWGVA